MATEWFKCRKTGYDGISARLSPDFIPIERYGMDENEYITPMLGIKRCIETASADSS